MRIATKAEFLNRHREGLLGNKIVAWPSIAAAKLAGHTGELAIRYAGPDSQWMKYHVPIDQADAYIASCAAQGANPDLFYLFAKPKAPTAKPLPPAT